MAGTEVTIHNEINVRVQAQIFIGRTLVGTCVASPGEICVLPSEQTRFDIFFKNSVTGWEIARKLDIEAETLTLSQQKGRYVITWTLADAKAKSQARFSQNALEKVRLLSWLFSR